MEISDEMVVRARTAFFKEMHRQVPDCSVPIWLAIDLDTFRAALESMLQTWEKLPHPDS